MNSSLRLVKADYLQRTRSYVFLITLAVSMYGAYVFVPAPDAAYVTFKIGNHVGEYNSAWIGHATAILTSTFLFLFGFFLITGGISRDVSTGVGQIIATTSVSNLRYLLSKALSNFLVLFTIAMVVMLMSMGMLIFRSGEFSLNPIQFLLPYLLVTTPSIFIVSCVAVMSEVLLSRWKVLQYLGFFILFNMMLANLRGIEDSNIGRLLDPLGTTMVTSWLKNHVQNDLGAAENGVSIGFNFGSKSEIQRFDFQGVQWTLAYFLSRVVYVLVSLGLLLFAARIFHRFDIRERMRTSKENGQVNIHAEPSTEWKRQALPAITPDFGILPLIRVEFLMLIRKGTKWLWLPTLGLMIAMIFTKLEIAHMMLLPILWFLQVGRWSDLATKEVEHGIHHFTFASMRPLTRLLLSQVIAAVTLAILLASPLLMRYALVGDWISIASILTGALFVVSLALILGIISGGKKLFEVGYFFLTYAHINKAQGLDYFGGMGGSVQTILTVLAAITVLLLVGFSVRKVQIIM